VGANNWPFAAALSIIFMMAVIAVVAVLSRLARASETHGQT
jgi:putative spermidine/putrescine transport system permease protein